jgi:hypothetical protein
MNRRTFLTTTSLAGLASGAAVNTLAQIPAAGIRDYLELRQYAVDTEAQKTGLETFLQQAAIPAMNRLGIQPVGVFVPAEGISPVYVLLRHKNLESFATLTQRLLADVEYLRKGAEFLDAPAEAPAFKRMQSALLLAITGIPQLETPAKSPGRVFQLRIYQSPSVKTGHKKIEMFNIGELKVFREVGLNPVFFGEAMLGTDMPNLTYMLGFESMAAQQEAWKKFGSHPEWQRLKAMPEYADKKILCGINNISLKPAACSQI